MFNCQQPFLPIMLPSPLTPHLGKLWESPSSSTKRCEISNQPRPSCPWELLPHIHSLTCIETPSHLWPSRVISDLRERCWALPREAYYGGNNFFPPFPGACGTLSVSTCEPNLRASPPPKGDHSTCLIICDKFSYFLLLFLSSIIILSINYVATAREISSTGRR